jgi:5-methylcytosine-specific restriction endonuclease McrA
MSLPRTSKQGLTLDHVIPLSKGGTDTMDNLRPAHWLCNIKKSNKLPEEVNA